MTSLTSKASPSWSSDPRGSHAVRGTLVVVVPTVEGILIAADSRATAAGRFIDDIDKIEVAPTDHPVVFALTGLTEFLAPCPDHLSLNEWVSELRFSFRARDIVNRYYALTPHFTLRQDSFTELARTLAVHYQRYLMTVPYLWPTLSCKPLCRLVACQINPQDHRPIYASVRFDLGRDGLAPTDLIVNTYSPTDPLDIILVGEGRYAVDHVLTGVGRPFMSEEALALFEGDFQILDVTLDQADRLAISIIEATEATTALVPTPDRIGIGGPIQRAFLTSDQVVLHSPRSPNRP